MATLKPRASLESDRGWYFKFTCDLYNYSTAYNSLLLPYFCKLGKNTKRIVNIGL
jgi:hypothetical protein